jgi:hypothetical protein
MNKLATEDGLAPISFAGHDSFALRHAWLEKAYHEVENFQGVGNPFTAQDSIVRFGVGKNMVNAIKHWALACKFVEKTDSTYKSSEYAKFIMKRHDPYFEKRSTVWKIHYEMAKNPLNTTINWIFSFLNAPSFSREYLEKKLVEYCLEKRGQVPALKTLKTDISVSLSMYCKHRTEASSSEDDLSSPLQELGLIRLNQDGTYSVVIGHKKTLSDTLLISAIIEYWMSHDPLSASIRLDTLLYGPASPGRIFALSQADFAERVMKLSETTNGMLEVSETAGIFQIFKNQRTFDASVLMEAWKSE